MTVGIGFVSPDGWATLACDSRVSAGTLKSPNTKKIHSLGSLALVAAGDLGQSQKLLRRVGSLHSVEELASSMEELNTTELELLVVDLEGLYLVTLGECNAVCVLPIEPGRYTTIGSGGAYVHGYLEAQPIPNTPAGSVKLCKTAMKACSKHYMCVGAPFSGKTIWL